MLLMISTTGFPPNKIHNYLIHFKLDVLALKFDICDLDMNCLINIFRSISKEKLFFWMTSSLFY